MDETLLHTFLKIAHKNLEQIGNFLHAVHGTVSTIVSIADSLFIVYELLGNVRIIIAITNILLLTNAHIFY